MSLILELVTTGAAQSVPASRKVFSAAGGTIGRAKHSDWVLPDAKVSARHARVSCVNGVFYIEDTSTNGVFLNSPNTRLVRGQPHALQSGDRLLIEPYEIQVSATPDTDDTILGPAGSAARRDAPGAPFDVDPFASDLPFPALRPAVSPASPPGHGSFDPIAEPHADDELDPLKLLGPGPQVPPARKGPSAADLSQGSPLDAHYRPPPVVTPPPASATLPKERQERSPTVIPENYDPLAPDTFSGLEPARAIGRGESPPALSSEPLPPPPPKPARESAVLGSAAPGGGQHASASPAPPPRADVSAHGDLAAVLAAAGLGGVPVTPELAAQFGEILRIVVTGVMDVLRSRNQVKDEFRMRMTHFRPVDNNPLKFSANVDDALHNLLVKRNEAYLGPVDAFQDAFDDLRNHQLAMLAGMRVAFEFTLAQFDPDRLQEQFDQQAKKGSVFAVGTKLRYWDLFRERRRDLARDPEASFRDLFGEAFAEAYEVQMKRLKDEHRRT